MGHSQTEERATGNPNLSLNYRATSRLYPWKNAATTHDPGVCRDEIAIAIGVKGGTIQTILVESEQEVQLPVNVGHLQDGPRLHSLNGNPSNMLLLDHEHGLAG